MFKPNIALIGPNKSINTAVGELLAAELELHYLDTDAYIEYEENLPVKHIIADFGATHYYKLEKKYIRRLDTFEDTVIATSATAVMDEDNTKKLLEFCYVVLLYSDPSTVLKRMRDEQTQLLKADIMARSREFFSNINAHLKFIVNYALDTTARSPHMLKEMIVQKLSSMV